MNKKLSKTIFMLSLFALVLLFSAASVTVSKAATYQTTDSDYEYENDGSGVRIIKYTGVTLQQVSDPTYAVVVPDRIAGRTVKSIGSYAFAEQKRISQFVLPKTVTAIGDHAFYNCQSLTTLKLPSTLTKIGDYAFYNTQLKTISIPKKVSSIGSYAFGCDGTDVSAKCSAITVNKSNKKFCTVDGVLYNKAKTKLIYYPGAKKSSSFTVPAKVTGMTAWAFNDARKIKELSMNKCKITAVPEYALCLSNLQKVSLPASLKNVGAHAFEKSGIAAITIPSKVSSIGEAAFYNCGSLKKVTISAKNLTELKKQTFASCYALTTVKLPASLEKVGEAAFSSCISLKKVTLPAKVVSIENEAFRMCEALTNVIIKGTVTHIGFTAFDGDTNLTITAKKGTYPEDFAKQKNINFKKL